MRCTLDLEVSCMTSRVMHFLQFIVVSTVYYPFVNLCCHVFHLPFLVCFFV